MKLREVLSYIKTAEPEHLELDVVAAGRLVTGIGYDDQGRLYMSLEKKESDPGMEGLPSNLSDIDRIKMVVDQHDELFPGHVLNCTCLEDEIRQLRALLHRTYKDQVEQNGKARRWAYVVQSAAKNLW